MHTNNIIYMLTASLFAVSIHVSAQTTSLPRFDHDSSIPHVSARMIRFDHDSIIQLKNSLIRLDSSKTRPAILQYRLILDTPRPAVLEQRIFLSDTTRPSILQRRPSSVLFPSARLPLLRPMPRSGERPPQNGLPENLPGDGVILVFNTPTTATIRIMKPDNMPCLVPDLSIVEHMPIQPMPNTNPIDPMPGSKHK